MSLLMYEYDSSIANKIGRPVHTNTFALPQDVDVKFAYAVYNPSDEALLLDSEKGRQIFAETFITDPKLGTLSDLCARTIAAGKGLASLIISDNDPLKRRLQLDSISIDEPLENIYEIEDKRFWKRIALSKTKDVTLTLKDDNYDWKSEGLTLKFLDLIEECPAEYWPEVKMCELARKIKDYIIHLHISKLQPLKDSAFLHYNVRDSDTDKTTSTDVSSSTEDSEIVTEEEKEESKSIRSSTKSFNAGVLRRRSQLSSILAGRESDEDEENNYESLRLVDKVEQQKEKRREDRRKRRISQQNRRKLREEKRLKREEARNQPKPRRIRVKNVFDLPIEEPEDQEHKQQDHRNLASYLKLKKKNIYQMEHCHHIDLRFLCHLEELVSLQIEFQPPPLKTKYHPRYFEFSRDDITGLACGIISLQKLRIFRLRDSRMDAEKLTSIVFALKELKVEVLDFGNDHLHDDCEIPLLELLEGTITIKSLELEGNQLGVNSMSALGRSLQRYRGKLEYLGLARNPIGSEGIHALCSKIAYTEQIQSICLAGIRITDVAMLCCIGSELLVKHKVLRSLDIMSSPLSSRSGEHLVKCMRSNYNIVNLECRGCNMHESVEMDIEICVQRNRFKAEHSFIGNKSITEADINEYVRKIRNPILLAVNEQMQKKKACIDARPTITKIYSTPSEGSTAIISPTVSTEYDFTYLRGFSKSNPAVDDTLNHVIREESSDQSQEPFDYNPTNFDEKQILEQVDLPGPSNRYYYFKYKNHRSFEH